VVDLPIDHFRLLGVGPAADAQEVLRTLQQRLERVPEDGFTADTLQARAELLRASADLLSHPERRSAYEADLLAVDQAGGSVLPALEIPSSREVAGLLLLLEADQPLDAFEASARALQPPQAPALGSGREADLSLLAGLACLAGAEELKQQRHFEAAAQILQRGLQLLQRMGQVPELRERLGEEVHRLTPYRVLDLLRRDLGAVEQRREGLQLLEQLVQRRGGLEGDNDPQFPIAEFQPFFQQIRAYLTVQEQVDLFERWAAEGSSAADFLACTALTASGFVQRKPERIAAARDRLLASGREGLDPLLSNLHLLLGEVDRAQERFERGAGPELRAWAARQSGDSLGQQCAYCRDWLARDVLPGYRDLDADADLESYFSDRDVVAYVEREDRRSGRSYAPAPAPSAAPAATASPATAGSLSPTDFGAELGGEFASSFGAGSFNPGGFSEGTFSEPGFGAAPEADPFTPGSLSRRRGATAGSTADGDDADGDRDGDGPLWLSRLRLLPASLGAALAARFAGQGGSDDDLDRRPDAATGPFGEPGISLTPSTDENAEAPAGLTLPPTPWLIGGAAAAVVVLLAAALLWPRPAERTPATARPIPVQPLRPDASPPAGAPQATAAKPTAKPAAKPAATAATGLPLTAAAPEPAQLQPLLEAWLAAKAAVLAGNAPADELASLVRPEMAARLQAERREDEARGETQAITVRVRSLRLVERSPQRIAVEAELAYSDQRRGSGGKVLERTEPTTLRNIYVFGRDGDRWRLAATLPASS
jgi:hypothetical protein